MHSRFREVGNDHLLLSIELLHSFLHTMEPPVKDPSRSNNIPTKDTILDPFPISLFLTSKKRTTSHKDKMTGLKIQRVIVNLSIAVLWCLCCCYCSTSRHGGSVWSPCSHWSGRPWWSHALTTSWRPWRETSNQKTKTSMILSCIDHSSTLKYALVLRPYKGLVTFSTFIAHVYQLKVLANSLILHVR